MKRVPCLLSAVLLSAAVLLPAQSSSSASFVNDNSTTVEGAGVASTVTPHPGTSSARFSRVGFGVGLSPLGVRMEMTTNLSSHLNLRAVGNLFNYATTFTTDGIGANAKLNMASAGTSLDVYPFRSGFRISPGVLLYNKNEVTAAASVAGGTSFTLNNQTYYSANANAATGATPITGSALLNLHPDNPAFSITTGWGNTARGHGHWSFPFEIGAAFIGAPKAQVNLGGWACVDQAQQYCSNINDPSSNVAAQIQSNLNTQIAKWNSDLEPLKTFPIVSLGVAYSVHVRSTH